MIRETHSCLSATSAGPDVNMSISNDSHTAILNIENQLLSPLDMQTTQSFDYVPSAYHQQQKDPQFFFHAHDHSQQHHQHDHIITNLAGEQQVCGVNLTATDSQLIELAGCLLSLDSYPMNNNSAAVKAEAANLSDASTVEETNHEAAEDDAIAYLQGLNSGNLMQCSQQSVVQELLNKESFDVRPTISEIFREVTNVNENLDIKPNVNALPTLEEHDNGGYKFQLNPRHSRKGKINGTYSEKLNKIYLRRHETFCIVASYTPTIPSQQLRLRAVLCFAKEVSTPVLRCQNHISQETDVPANVRQSLMRCENPSVEYCGSAEGKSLSDRFSVLIPLGLDTSKTQENSIKQTIALKFTCQNSCVGRKETSIIFLLENIKGEVLGQRVLDVRICSCPKRDRGMDERAYNSRSNSNNINGLSSTVGGVKRKQSDEDLDGVARKKLKEESLGSIKAERSNSLSDLDDKFDVQLTPNGEVVLKCQFSDKLAALHTIRCAQNMVANQYMTTPEESKCKQRRQRIWRRFKRLYDKLEKM